MSRALFAISILAASIGPAPALAATFVVESTADTPDGDSRDDACKDASGVCTLRAAIQQANVTAGTDRIEFAIPGAGPHVIHTVPLPLPAITSDLVIDGYSQPGASRNTLLAGTNAQLEIVIEGDVGGPFVFGTGLEVLQGVVLLQGLAIRGFADGVVFNQIVPMSGSISGSVLRGSRIEQCASSGVVVIGSGVRIGGPGIEARNLLSDNLTGVTLSDGATFVTNNLIGTDASGTTALGNLQGILLGGGSHAITDNVISGNTIGIAIGPESSANTIVRNLIGISANGRTRLGNLRAMDVQGGQNQIGLPSPSRVDANVISANGTGITITGNGNLVQGNYLGTGPGGSGGGAFGNDTDAIVILADGNVIGAPVGTIPNGHGNVIAFNGLRGVALPSRLSPRQPESKRNTLRANRVWANQFSDIDLGADGVFDNDLGDLDDGPNNRQNAPVIDSVTVSPNLIQIEGKLDTLPGSYTIDFYSSAACDGPPDTGSGEFYLGSAPAPVAAGGSTFSATFHTTALGHGFSAIATDANGNSSELGPCFDAQLAGGADLSVSVSIDPSEQEVVPGQAVQFAVRVENAGPAVATNVPVVIVRPAGFASWSSTGPGSYDAISGVWSAENISPGATATLTFDATIDGIAAGPIVIEARAVEGLAQFDPDLAGNQSSASFDVRTGADLVLTQSMPPAAQPGDLVAINLAVRNDGPEAAIGVVLSGQLDANLDLDVATAPAGLTFNGATRRWTLSVGDLAVNATANVVLKVKVSPATVLGSGLKQTVVAFAPTILDPSPELASSVLAVGLAADLHLTIAPESQDWELTIYNSGPGRVAGFELLIENCGDEEASIGNCSGACPLVCTIPTPIEPGLIANLSFEFRPSEYKATVRSAATMPYHETDPTDNSMTTLHHPPSCGLLGPDTPLTVGLVALRRGRRGRRGSRRIPGAGVGLLGLALLAASPEPARAVPIVLSVDPGASSATVSISSLLGSPPPVAVSLSGNVSADVDFANDAPLGLTAQSLQLTGATLRLSDVTFVLSSTPRYDLTFASSGAGASLSGPIASGFAVAPGLSLVDLVGAQLSFDTGSITAAGTFLGEAVNETLDLGNTPFVSPFPINSVAQVRVIELDGGSVSIRLSVPFSAPLRVSTGGDEVTVAIAGTLVQQGVVVPEPASALLLAAGLLSLAWLGRRRGVWHADATRSDLAGLSKAC